ncbi:radical SAM family heme chaperone HemW [Gulosibacter bifidus]|uniref:Heme chaperone HemW n=1 Tax=Gulosibacter bifidus TaxID=272239 RepID=A0ABW5RG56_9MICO|nr:radical SAM family heme chaperone HemW [Gulosibacter bifidus]
MPPSALPLGAPLPASGALPASVADGIHQRQFGAYVHIPFCRVRCGYCDFNTYTATELAGASPREYPASLGAEIALARTVLDELGHDAPLSTVFFGGGTPTLLPAESLIEVLQQLRSTFGIVDGAEVSVEANPDSVDADYLSRLAAGGVTRVSFGVQSAVPHVLDTLDRTHDPERVAPVVAAAKAAGLSTSVDLIYGTPGESLADWQASLDLACSLEPDHISAYALIIEDGTAIARQIRRGEIAPVDDDLQADMYELADATLTQAGYEWYELSNWSRDGAHPSRHNLAYWQDTDWWGFGPGAHSHINGVRFWNVKHPTAYATRLTKGESPAAGHELLDATQRADERILLQTRLRSGIAVSELRALGGANVQAEIAACIADGLVDGALALQGRIVLTLRGRLLADIVARRLCP